MAHCCRFSVYVKGISGGGLKGANSTVYGLPVGVCADWIG